MAELSTVARPYAEAAFGVAKAGDLAAWSALMEKMAAVAGNADMRAVIANPKLSDAQVYDVFAAAVGDKLGAEASNFVRLLIENGRLVLLPEVAAQFAQLKNAHQGTADAFIESAFALTDAQVTDLVAALEKKFKVKLKPQVKVDAGLIGGVRVVVGDQVLDSSVRENLQRMATALTA
jgi:F-type H+-transporting ATPase subunit delta